MNPIKKILNQLGKLLESLSNLSLKIMASTRKKKLLHHKDDLTEAAAIFIHVKVT